MTVRGMDDLRKRLRALSPELKAELQLAFTEVAVRVQAHAVKSIQQGPKTGRTYKRGKVVHRASAPGQAPATDTGALASSVARVDGEMAAAVGTALAHGKHLEVGTKDMAARPWLFPAMEANRVYYIDRVRKAYERAAKKIARGK